MTVVMQRGERPNRGWGRKRHEFKQQDDLGRGVSDQPEVVRSRL
jgi:hypothetical protein